MHGLHTTGPHEMYPSLTCTLKGKSSGPRRTRAIFSSWDLQEVQCRHAIGKGSSALHLASRDPWSHIARLNAKSHPRSVSSRKAQRVYATCGATHQLLLEAGCVTFADTWPDAKSTKVLSICRPKGWLDTYQASLAVILRAVCGQPMACCLIIMAATFKHAGRSRSARQVES
jgi:hypothetical protein